MPPFLFVEAIGGFKRDPPVAFRVTPSGVRIARERATLSGSSLTTGH